MHFVLLSNHLCIVKVEQAAFAACDIQVFVGGGGMDDDDHDNNGDGEDNGGGGGGGVDDDDDAGVDDDGGGGIDSYHQEKYCK